MLPTCDKGFVAEQAVMIHAFRLPTAKLSVMGQDVDSLIATEWYLYLFPLREACDVCYLISSHECS